MTVQCTACGGTYAPTLPDGTRYYHACAPILDVDGKTYVARPNARNENVPLPAPRAEAATLPPDLQAAVVAGAVVVVPVKGA